jgi:hypothetical protein
MHCVNSWINSGKSHCANSIKLLCVNSWIISWIKKIFNYHTTAATISRHPSRSNRYRNNGKLRRCLRIAMGSLLCVAAAAVDTQFQLRPGEEHINVGLNEAIQVCSSVVMSANTTTSGYDPHHTQWDSDSMRIGVDCRASACLSDQRSDFPG